MKTLRWLLGLALLTPALHAVKPEPPKPTAVAVLNQLTWLAGKWRSEKAGRVVDEQWMSPAAGVMLGMARTILRGKVTEHEFMQVREGPGGALFFIAQPSGQKEAAFLLKSLGPAEAVFENLQHDFPQRIIYALQPDGSLLAAIEGPGGEEGKDRRIEFLFKRIQP